MDTGTILIMTAAGGAVISAIMQMVKILNDN